jgi:hypothetical protein
VISLSLSTNSQGRNLLCSTSDPGGYWWPPTYSTGSKNSLWVPNFHGCYEALNDVFCGFGAQVTAKSTYLCQSKIGSLDYTFPMLYRVPQIDIVCKRYTPGKLTHQLPLSGPANLLDFHLLGLRFWILLMIKRPLEPHCNNHILSNVSIHHISSQR